MMLVDSERRFLAVNRPAGELVKRPDSELLGRHVEEVVPDREHPALQVAWQRLNAASTDAGEMELLRSDGSSTKVVYVARVTEVTDGRVALCIADPVTPDERARAVPGDRPLTPRELEAVRLVAAGLTEGAIAEALYISPLTVHTHLRNAMRKVGAHTRAHLVAIALRRGLV
jgi:PAS domain S-box-containing protein